jgi:hypothetical protein
MVFPFFTAKRGSSSSSKPGTKSRRGKKSPTQCRLEEIGRQKLEIECSREKILQRLEDFPRREEERQRRRQEFIRKRAKNTATTYADGVPSRKLRSLTKVSFSLRKSERRFALLKLLLLCGVLVVFVLFLLKALP